MENNSERVLFWKMLLGDYVSLPTARILEIGCGDGAFGLFLADNIVGSYTGIDPDMKRIAHAKEQIGVRKNVRYLIGKAEQIPLDEKFDIVLYTRSWHFVRDYDKAIAETQRVLTPNGILAILEPSEKKTNGWASNLLNKDHPDFSASEFEKKVQDLRRARQALVTQRTFNLVKELTGDEHRPNLWILRKYQTT